jgi:hypothetical protein
MMPGMRWLVIFFRSALFCAVLGVGGMVACAAWAGPAAWPAAPIRDLPSPSLATTDEPGMQCRQAIRSAETAAGIPSQLMAAIGHVESGRPDAQGVIQPWPWSINAEGEGHFYASKAEAIAAVRALQAHGVRSIDVGCMQVNLMHHPDAFASLDQAFDPLANATYAARFLNQLHDQSHDWSHAVADYHSATPAIGSDYERKVAEVWPEERARLATTPQPPGNVWSTNVWTANVWNSSGNAPGGGNMLSNGASHARVIPAPSGTVGRGLDAYRAAPVTVTSRQLPRAQM